jgi:hypothetical protein
LGGAIGDIMVVRLGVVGVWWTAWTDRGMGGIAVTLVGISEEEVAK